jgi:fructokinase
LVDLARRARQEELLLVFEPNHLSRGTRNEQAAVFSDVVKFSRESGVTASEWLPPRNASTRVVIETLGGDGLKYRLRGEHRRWSRWKHVPAIASANVVDTAGAGDWCTAGVIEELARTPAPIRWAPPSIERALAFGQALAAVSLSFHGPRGVLSETRATAIRRVARAASAAGAVSPASVLGLRNNATLPPLTVVEESRACALCLSPLETRGPNR